MSHLQSSVRMADPAEVIFYVALNLIGAFIGLYCVIELIKKLLRITVFKNSGVPFVEIDDITLGARSCYYDGRFCILVNELHKKLGDYLGILIANEPQVHTRDPELIYRVFVKDGNKNINRYPVHIPGRWMRMGLPGARDGYWRRVRRAVASTLTVTKLKTDNVLRDIDDVMHIAMNHVESKFKAKPLTDDSITLATKRFFKSIVLEITLRVLFNNTNNDFLDDSGNKLRNTQADAIPKTINPVARWCNYFPSLIWLIEFIYPYVASFGYASKGMFKELDRIIDGEVKYDASTRRLIHSLIDTYREGSISYEELVANAFFLMTAGVDTVTDSLATLLMCLANNPQKQVKLRDDLIRHGDQSKYVEYCLKEAHRLYPPITYSTRELVEDLEWQGMTLRKGWAITTSVYSVHYNENYWGDRITEFLPERHILKDESTAPSWMKTPTEAEMSGASSPTTNSATSNEQQTKAADTPNNKFGDEDANMLGGEKFGRMPVEHGARYLGFGVGPRYCAGYHLAMIMMKKILINLLLKYEVQRVPTTPRHIKLITTAPWVGSFRGRVEVKLVELKK